MKRLFFHRILFLCLLIATAGIGIAVTAQNPDLRGMGGVGLTVFSDRNFRGRSATYQYDISSLAGTGFDNQISSLRVGPGEQWEICDRPNYGGSCVVVYGEESDLRKNNWDNKISSFRRVSGTSPQPPTPSGPVTLYTQVNYRGNPATYAGPTPNLYQNSRRASSVMITSGTWQFCEGANYSGRCITLSSSVSNLGSYGMQNRITSLRPVSGTTPPPTTNPYVVLYSQQNYRGTANSYDSTRSNIRATTRSVTIGSGTWRLCDGVGFTGRCITLSQSVSDLSGYNIGRTIRSVSPDSSPTGPSYGNQLLLYTGVNYNGIPTSYSRGMSVTAKSALSARVFNGAWQICDGRNYTGRCITVSQDSPNLRDYRIGPVIRSVRPLTN